MANQLASAEKAFRTKGAWSPSRLALVAEYPMSRVLFMRTQPKEPTKDMRWGTALHALLLQPDDIDRHLIVWDRPLLNCKADIKEERKAEIAMVEADAKKTRRTIVDIEMFETAQDATKVAAETFAKLYDINEWARAWCDETLICEQKIGWETDGLPMHGIIDGLVPAFTDFGDIKTIRDASDDAAQKDIYNRRYHVKLAAYHAAIRQWFGIDSTVWIPFVENTPPYCTRVVELDRMALEEGSRVYLECVAKIKAYETDHDGWHGYPLTSPTVGIPRWAYGR